MQPLVGRVQYTIVHVALMVLVVVTCTGGSCNSGDPPSTTNVLLEVNRQAMRAGFDRLDFTVERVEVFYDTPPAGLPIDEGVDNDCAFPNSVLATGSIGATGFDMHAKGLVPVGGFQAPSGNVTEIRLVLEEDPLLTVKGQRATIKGQLRCSDSGSEPPDAAPEHQTSDHEVVLRFIPSAPIPFVANSTAVLQVDFDPNRDIFTGEAGAQSGNQGSGHAGANGGNGKGGVNGNGTGTGALGSPGLRLAGSYTLEAVPLDRDLIIPGLLFVTFRPGVTAGQIATVNASIGASVIWQPYPFAEQVHVYGDEEAAIFKLQGLPDSLYVNGAVPELRTHITTLPNDFDPSEYYMMANNTNVVGVWNLNPPQVGSRSIIIAVIDTGVDLDNRDLLQNMFVNVGELPAAWQQDIDGDGVISFHDFNPDDATQKQTVAALLAQQKFVDVNMNGVVDPYDFLSSQNNIVDGKDNDNNGHVDDLVGWDFSGILDVNGTAVGGTGTNNPSDDNGHGTVVASIAAAVGNNANMLLPGASGGGIAGVTWLARILPIKVGLSSGDGQGLMPIATAAKYAQDLGATVAVSSLAATAVKKNADVSGCTEQLEISSSNSAFDDVKTNAQANWAAFNLSIPVVASLANCTFDYDSGNFFTYPGGLGAVNVISVTATDQSDALASFAPHGANSIDIGAPGVGILALPVHGTNPGPVSGTSAAAPLVAGTIALMVNRNPSLKGQAAQIRQRIVQNGDQTGIATRGGRLDAFKAVTAP